METIEQIVSALEKALEAGPTPGPWATAHRGTYWGEPEADVIDAEGYDVDGVERVLPINGQDTTRGQAWERDANYIAACSPDRIKRVIEALKEAHKRNGLTAQAGLALNAMTEAKLSRALELLKEATDEVDPLFAERIDAFLKEQGQ